jgi:hypothetical protein
MTDPERILDRPPSELAARLLRAGSDEAPSPRSLQRTLSALGVGATALGAAGSAGALAAAKTASTLSLVVLSKWAGFGVLGGVVVAAAAHGLNPPARQVAPGAPSAVLTSATAAPHSPVAREAPRATDVALAIAEPAPPPATPRSAPPALTEPELEAPLAAEVAFVDRGRAAFQRGELTSALAALAGYEREFPEPRLLPEVLYLRMEASNRRGDRARALSLAERILRDYPRSPQVASARAVLAER